MDHDDDIKYDEMISKLKGKQVDSDKKISIASEMLDNLINTTEQLNNNTTAKKSLPTKFWFLVLISLEHLIHIWNKKCSYDN